MACYHCGQDHSSWVECPAKKQERLLREQLDQLKRQTELAEQQKLADDPYVQEARQRADKEKQLLHEEFQRRYGEPETPEEERRTTRVWYMICLFGGLVPILGLLLLFICFMTIDSSRRDDPHGCRDGSLGCLTVLAAQALGWYVISRLF